MLTPSQPAPRDQSCPANTVSAPRSAAMFTFGTGNAFAFQGAGFPLVNRTATKKGAD